ncbi:MAG: Crp/Fnr family transcriptional regulator [Candidatus Cryptobacteroides sp.]
MATENHNPGGTVSTTTAMQPRHSANSGENLDTLFRELANVNEDCFEILRKHISYRQVRKGTIIVKPGDTNFNIFIILKGMGASYCITKQGDCKYLYLSLPSYVVTSIHTLHNGCPAKDYIELLKGSAVAIIDGNVLKGLAREHPAVSEWYINLLIRGLNNVCGRLEDMLSTSAKDRLLALMRDNQNLFSKAMKKQIAGYLGVDQSTLSRLLSAKM